MVVGRDSYGKVVKVERISGTNIFARMGERGRQILVYGMDIASSVDLAMILPVPIAADAGEDALRFVNLEGYPDFFADMREGFPEYERTPPPQGGGAARSAPARVRLPVYTVGQFEASFVPSMNDWDRLDPRFHLPSDAWEKLPQYRDYGFAVFKLRSTRSWFGLRTRPRTIHPMAFEFSSRTPSELFFPTVHVHDGEVHEHASFDHAIFMQTKTRTGWRESTGAASTFLKTDKSANLVVASEPVFRQMLEGTLPNRDTTVPIQ